VDTTDGGQPQIHVYETDCDCSLVEVQNITDGLPTEADRNSTDNVVNGVVGLAQWYSLPSLFD